MRFVIQRVQHAEVKVDGGILASLVSLTLAVGILHILTRKAKIKAIKY